MGVLVFFFSFILSFFSVVVYVDRDPGLDDADADLTITGHG